MATVTHSFVNPHADGPDTTIVRPSDWNAEHVVEGVREMLEADRTYYVRTNGNDLNTGLANTAAGAFLTIQAAIDFVLHNIDVCNHTITIQVADGTYDEISLQSTLVGSDPNHISNLVILGNQGTPANVVITSFYGWGCGYVEFSGFKVTDNLEVDIGSLVYVSHCTLKQGSAYNGGILELGNGNTFTGSADYALWADGGAIIYLDSHTFTISGTPAYGEGFAVTSLGGIINRSAATFSGAATGKRFDGSLNGIFYTNNGGVDLFPGDTPGTLVSGSVYDDLIGGVREMLTADRTYYVRTDGNDDNTGLVNNAGGAFLTGTACWKAICALDCNGHVITMQFADGTYADGLFSTCGDVSPGGVDYNTNTMYVPTNCGFVHVLGNTSTPANCVVHCSEITDYAAVDIQHTTPTYVYVQGFTFDGDDSLLWPVWVTARASLAVSDCRFINCAGSGGSLITVGGGARVQVENTIEVATDCDNVIAVLADGYFLNFAEGWTLTGTPEWGVSFLFQYLFSEAYFVATPVTGTAIGKQYDIYGELSDEGFAFPGDEAGTFYNRREKLTADRTYYVRTDGSDMNTGRANTAAGAFLTIQAAINFVLHNLDFASYRVVIQVADGTYSENPGIDGPPVGGDAIVEVPLSIVGNAGSPGNVVVNSFYGFACGYVTVSGFTFTGVVQADQMTWMDFDSCVFNHVMVTNTGVLGVRGSCTFSGAAPYAMWANSNAIIYCVNGATITGTPAYGNAFALATTGGFIEASGSTFSGSATGVRYLSSLNSIINTSGGGATFFPGDSAGSTATGGQYV